MFGDNVDGYSAISEPLLLAHATLQEYMFNEIRLKSCQGTPLGEAVGKYWAPCVQEELLHHVTLRLVSSKVMKFRKFVLIPPAFLILSLLCSVPLSLSPSLAFGGGVSGLCSH